MKPLHRIPETTRVFYRGLVGINDLSQSLRARNGNGANSKGRTRPRRRGAPQTAHGFASTGGLVAGGVPSRRAEPRPVFGASVRPLRLVGAKPVVCCQDMGNRCYQDIGYTLPTRPRRGVGVGAPGAIRLVPPARAVSKPRLRHRPPPFTPAHATPLTSPHPPL